VAECSGIVRKINVSLEDGLKERHKRAFTKPYNKKMMPSLPAALRLCNFLVMPRLTSLDIDISEGISCEYEALVISERSVSGIGIKNCILNRGCSSS
jgi:hypothetical protein